MTPSNAKDAQQTKKKRMRSLDTVLKVDALKQVAPPRDEDPTKKKKKRTLDDFRGSVKPIASHSAPKQVTSPNSWRVNLLSYLSFLQIHTVDFGGFIKVNLLRAINFRASCGANLVTQYPRFRPKRNLRNPPCEDITSRPRPALLRAPRTRSLSCGPHQ